MRSGGTKPRWKEARQRLKENGVKIMETGYYETEPPLCGCGAKLGPPGTSAPNGKIDRLTYYILRAARGTQSGARALLADLVKPEHVVPE